ncbi:hypothetical protein ACFLQV_01280 [Calditrichota bacterium]
MKRYEPKVGDDFNLTVGGRSLTGKIKIVQENLITVTFERDGVVGEASLRYSNLPLLDEKEEEKSAPEPLPGSPEAELEEIERKYGSRGGRHGT